MPKIETQGLSEDYQTATGEFEVMDRGDLSKIEILDILKKVSRLTTPQELDSFPSYYATGTRQLPAIG